MSEQTQIERLEVCVVETDDARRLSVREFVHTPLGAIAGTAVLICVCALVVSVAFVPVPLCLPGPVGAAPQTMLGGGFDLFVLGVGYAMLLCTGVALTLLLKRRLRKNGHSTTTRMVIAVVLLLCALAAAVFICDLALTINNHVGFCVVTS